MAPAKDLLFAQKIEKVPMFLTRRQYLRLTSDTIMKAAQIVDEEAAGMEFEEKVSLFLKGWRDSQKKQAFM